MPDPKKDDMQWKAPKQEPKPGSEVNFAEDDCL